MQLLREESTAKKSHGPASTVTGGGGKKKGCSLKQCHYLLPEKKKAVKTTPCGGCPYGKHVPCIGYCIARLYSEMKGKKGRG